MEPANSTLQKKRLDPPGNIKISFTNADTLTNKMAELSIRLRQEKPLVMGVSEVLPKHIKNKIQPEIFNVEDYEMVIHPTVTENKGRGSIIYVHKSMSYKQIYLDEDKNFDEILAIEIKINKKDTLLFALLYRNGDFTDWHIENNNKFYSVVKHIASLKYSHIVLMGDMNFRGINWETITNFEKNSLQKNENEIFIECIRDSFLFQHITEPTRHRGTDNPSTLDLVLTNEENLISNINIESPLGASDHSLISFCVDCCTPQSEPKIKVIYDKGDYSKIKNELNKLDWEILFQNHEDNVNMQWELFKNIYLSLEECVPRKKVFINGLESKKHSFPLDSTNLRKIKRKNKLWSKVWKKTSHGRRKTPTKKTEKSSQKTDKKSPKNCWKANC